MSVLILVTTWDPPMFSNAKGYWHRQNALVPFPKDKHGSNVFSDDVPNLVGEVPAIGLYAKGSNLKKDYSVLPPCYLKISNIQYDGTRKNILEMKVDFKGEEFDFPSDKLTPSIYEIARRKYNRIPLCFTLNNDEWGIIKQEFSLNPPTWWLELLNNSQNEDNLLAAKLKQKSNFASWLGDNFLNIINTSDWRQYEQVVAECFYSLGFRVRKLGYLSEKERSPDGYLYTPSGYALEDSFWITYDCKTRFLYPSDEDRAAEDERKMIEYIRKEEKVVETLRGVKRDNKFFLFVAHSFSPYARTICKKIEAQSRATGALITTDALLRLVEKRIRMGHRFALTNFTELISNTVIETKDIEKVYGKSGEFKYEE